MKTLSRSAAVWIAIGCVVLGAPSAGGADEAAAGIALGQSATLLPDGRWLMLGGLGATGPMGKAAIWDPRAIPAVVFTDPEIAWCGLTEADAKKQKREVKIGVFRWGFSGRATTAAGPARSLACTPAGR